MHDTSRRSFFGAVTATTAALAHTPKASAKPSKASTDLLSIGAVALGEGSHMNYEIWAPMFNPIENAVSWPLGRTTGMKITHCWDSRPEVSRAFAEKYGCTAVKNYHDMVGKVDGMVFAGFNEVPWWPQLTKPYLEAGIPCFINRPFAYSMKNAKEMVERARRHNTPILVTDERESTKEAELAQQRVRQLIKRGHRITGAHSDNAAGEWPQHGVHGLYYLLRVFGTGVERAAYVADGWWREPTPTATKQNYAELILQYPGLESDDARQDSPFLVSQYQNSATSDVNLRIYHADTWWDTVHPLIWSAPTRHLHLFYPTVLAMQEMFRTGTMPWSYDYILEKTRIFLTAFKSHIDHGGRLIRVSDLPDDWTAPNPAPDWIDENIFR